MSAKKRYIQCGANFRVNESGNLYQKHLAVGYNSGNLYIGYAVHKLFETERYFSLWQDYTDSEIDEIRETADAIVMAASNFINEKSDFEAGARTLERLKLPVIVLGIGAQAPDTSAKNLALKEGTKRFLYLLSELSVTIGVRGEYTAEILNGLGIKNCTVIGCPTYYINRNENFAVNVKRLEKDEEFAPVLNYSYLTQKCDEAIYKYAFQNKLDVIGQSQLIENHWKQGVPIDPQNEKLASHEKNVAQHYTNILGSDIDEIKRYFQNHFYQYYDVEQWAKEIRKYHFSFGTRFHGNMIAFQNGVPALLVTHDSRTQELAEFCNIPYLKAADLENGIHLRQWYSELDYGKLNREYPLKYKAYKEFLRANHFDEVDVLL